MAKIIEKDIKMAKIIEKVIDTNDTVETSDDKLLFLLVTDNADTSEQDDDKVYVLRKEIDKVFLQSENVNIFPCSRRGRYENTDGTVLQYDPEARLNTERTNRLHIAVNGFTPSFIESYVRDKVTKDENGNPIADPKPRTTGTLTFNLMGYHVEAKNFDPDVIATALGLAPSTGDKIYAYLRLHTGVSVDVENYFTEILYRQSPLPNNKNYLDVLYTDSYRDDKGKEHMINNEFFVGVSFVKEPIKVDANDYNLPLFSYTGKDESGNNKWDLIQTSLLPKIEHGETEDSIVITGNAEFNTNLNVKNQLTSKEINVPSDKPTETTTINDTGVQTFHTYTKSLEADGISVGGEISIIDGSTKTTIGAGTITAETDITTPKLKTNEIISDSADGLTIDPKTTLNNGLGVTKGDTTLQALEAKATTLSSLKVATDKFTVTDTAATFKAPVTVNNSLEVTDSVKTPALDVKTIENKVDNTGVSINDPLNIATGYAVATDTLKVNTINSRATNGTITVGSPVKVDNTLEVVSNATLTSNLTVGTDNNTNTGTIDAKKLVKVPTLDVQTIKNTKTDATTGANLGVSIEDALSITGATSVNNTITAKKLTITNIDENGEEKGEVVTPTLRVNRLTTNSGNITVDDKNLIVTKNLEVLAAKAIDEEDRGAAATATIDKAVIGQLEVKADATKLTGSTGKITAKEIAAEKITQNGNQVPAITLEQISDKGVTPEVWQLQIVNVIKKPKN